MTQITLLHILGITLLSIGCSNHPQPVETTTAKTEVEVPKDTLSEEQIKKMMAQDNSPTYSYSGILAANSEKEYFVEVDSNKNFTLQFNSDNDQIISTLYQLKIESIKSKDMDKKRKEEKLLPITDSAYYSTTVTKPTKYKILVKYETHNPDIDISAPYKVELFVK